MKIKGVSVITTKEFIKEKFGIDGYEKWENSLSEETAKLIKGNILASVWYPLKNGMVEPTKVMCDLFYDGEYIGAEKIGIYSADKSLHGVYRFFVRIASPNTLLKRATQIFKSFYDPSEIELVKISKDNYIMKFSEFDPPSPYTDYRILGWVRKALEICGAKNINVAIKKHAEIKSDFSELVITWD